MTLQLYFTRTTDGPGISPARFALLLLTVLSLACTANSADPPPSEETMSERPPIEQVLARRTPELMRMPGVEGVGQGLCDNEPCIRVFIRTETVRRTLPRVLEGYTVSAVVTGMVRPRTID